MSQLTRNSPTRPSAEVGAALQHAIEGLLGTFLLDDQGTVLACNPYAARLCRLSEADLVGRRIEDLPCAALGHDEAGHPQRPLSGPQRGPRQIYFPGEPPVTVSMSLEPVPLEAETQFLCVVQEAGGGEWASAEGARRSARSGEPPGLHLREGSAESLYPVEPILARSLGPARRVAGAGEDGLGLLQ